MRSLRFLAVPVLVVLAIAGCTATGKPTKPAAEQLPALFYAKNGVIYVSDPAGSPGRKLTDGPMDTQPAPSPDGKRLAYIHQTDQAQPGGELWVLDVASGKSRRLVDPAALTPTFQADDLQIDTPHWSPAGDRVAFLKSTHGGGGFLQTAAADTGAVLAPPQPMFAGQDYSWSSDGRRIAWVRGRSDVRSTDVNVYTVGGSWEPVAEDTNAFSAAFAADGSVLFANGDVDESLSPDAGFVLRQGGIYSVTPPAQPKALLTGQEFYNDVAALSSGAVGFTDASANPRSQTPVRTVRVLDAGADKPRTLGETTGMAQGPAWIADTVAYVSPDESQPLVIAATNSGDNPATVQVDSGVDSFAWAAGR